jgi:hypothetical protein
VPIVWKFWEPQSPWSLRACTGIALPLPLPFRTISSNKKNVGQKKSPQFCNEIFTTDTKGTGNTADNKTQLHIKSDMRIKLKYETWHIGTEDDYGSRQLDTSSICSLFQTSRQYSRLNDSNAGVTT